MRGRRTAVVALIIVAAVVAAAVVRSRLAGRTNGPRYRTAEVTRGDLLLNVSASGTVEAISLVDVRSRATGQVRTVLVEEGDRVRRGQVLVEIDDPDARAAVETARGALVAADARLSEAQAQVSVTRSATTTAIRQAEANLAAARARLAQVQGSRPEEIAQAEEAVRQAQANEGLARQNLARQEQLFNEGFISRSALDQARSQYEVAASQLRAAQTRLVQVRAGGSTQDVEIARAQLRQAEAQLVEARNGTLQVRLRMEQVVAARAQRGQAAANLRQAQDQLSETRITAPIDGVVVKRSVAVGQSVIGSASGGTPVLTLAQVTPVLAKVLVDESDIAQLTSRGEVVVEVTADALSGVTLAGRIERIAPQPIVEQNVTRYPVTVEVDDKQGALRLGMTVDAEFILARRTGVLLVPQEAVRGEGSKAVFTVEGTELKPRVVETGLSDGRFVEIVRGLREGETVYLGTARQTEPRQGVPGGSPFQPRLPGAPRR
ncbi:MAG TPA: efflux RND transporter periplasmic adaptor subunit [bacterium]|nr:efflux RND transporter periplasmic adaptor subunit [bacterium]